jgi:acetolactate synthase-1/2/3 large subunit
MNVAEIIVKILEYEGIKHVFGHPGEQIIPFYAALNNSEIKHILMRHEQGAVHAADAYARTSRNFSVCVSTAGPGALNMTMGIGVAYKDSVPMLIITGDNSVSSENRDRFQDIDVMNIFKPITFKSFNPSNGKIAISNLKEAINLLKYKPIGPIHINLPKNVLLEDIVDLKNPEDIKRLEDYNVDKNSNTSSSNIPGFNDYNSIDEVKDRIKQSKTPLIVAGAGILWGKAIEELETFSKNNKIPIVHTFHSKEIMNICSMDLGLVGIRGSVMANYAFDNSDLLIVLGSKLSERTISSGKETNATEKGRSIYGKIKTKIINVNIDENYLFGNIKIHGDVKNFLNKLNSFKNIAESVDSSWLDIISKYDEKINIEGLNSDKIPLKPQVAIDLIMDSFKDNIIVNDAGSHTTWVNIISEIHSNKKLIFSGGMAPMGYGLPATCGASIAKPDEPIILINGDGGFQMNIQELATISSNNLPVVIFVLNNFQLGIIRQWQEIYKNDLRYDVDLENPDFIALVKAYGIEGESVSSKEDLKLAIKDLKLEKPYLIEILIDEEDVPLPFAFK